MTFIRIASAVFLFIHGISHFVGFVVPWKIVTMKEQPYHTDIFFNKLDLGNIGIKAMGILWLVIGIGFVITAIGSIVSLDWWQKPVLYISFFSLLLCILGLPETKIGILANIIVIVFIVAGSKAGWFS